MMNTSKPNEVYVLSDYNSWDSNPYRFIGTFSSLEGAMGWIPEIMWSVEYPPSEYYQGSWKGTNGQKYNHRDMRIHVSTLHE